MPAYDEQTHRLEWAFQYASSDGTKTEDFNTRVLSRTGEMHVILVDDPDHTQSDIPDFNAAIAGLDFNPGQRYSDYQTGDKLAAYGLAGLIAGGAAAAVVKTDFLATAAAILAGFGKAIGAVILGVFAVALSSLKKLFRRR